MTLPFVAIAVALTASAQEEHSLFPVFDKPTTYGPVISVIHMRFPVGIEKGTEGTITFPIPSDFEGQRVLSFRVKAEQPDALISWKWRDRDDHLNRVCEVRVAPKGKGTWVSYEAIVLTPPSVGRPSSVGNPKDWLRPSKVVQADDADIRAIAKKLADGGGGEADLAKRIVMYVAKNSGDGKTNFTRLDAKSSIKNPGSCTNHAQFCAALFRASGIPARAISHMPTWGEGGMMYEHWATEYWSASRRWVLVEPTLGLAHPARNTIVQLAVSSVEDENRAEDPLHLRATMPGSAYLSLAELSEELKNADLPAPADEPSVQDDAMNQIQVLSKLPAKDASDVLHAADVRARKVEHEARHGRALSIDVSTLRGDVAPESVAKKLLGS